MTNQKITAAALMVCLVLMLSWSGPVSACTGIRLVAQDGAVVFARTLEFGSDIDSVVLMVPRGFARTATTPDGKPGLAWKSKYASVGANGAGLPLLFDGLNEKGLSVGTFYFPGTAGFMPYKPTDADKTLAQWEVGSWLLENFASVEEVRANIGKVVVPEVFFQAWGMAPPVHYAVNDATGAGIVIEYVGGALHVHDNPLGVMANSPSFAWHMTNLRNYINMSFENAKPIKYGSYTVDSLGQGSGMLGLPGDFTPPSRLVRAVAFSRGAGAFQSATGDEAVLHAFKILNNFDIPKGAVREREKDAQGNIQADYTLWTSANDLKGRRFFIRTYDNSQIRSVELMKLDLDSKELLRFSIKGKEVVVPLVQTKP